MYQEIFINATSYKHSPLFQVSGKLIVTIEGDLDGADVTTNLCKGERDEAQIISSCSWMSSNSTGFIGADEKYELVPNNFIYFALTNPGVNTNITLKFRIEAFNAQRNISTVETDYHAQYDVESNYV